MWDDIKRIEDAAEHVTKFVFTKGDAVAEAVLYRYPEYADRTVICCSTQSGCPVGCRFCGAGDHFARSLSTAEIVSQSKYLLDFVRLSTGTKPEDMGRLQIMFMSMGEPLLNLHNLIPALLELNGLYPNAALLISTIGPQLSARQWKSLVDICVGIPQIGLQFSIHETHDSTRDKLIPFKGKMSLGDIAAAGRGWHAMTGRKPFFNYCAHDGNVSLTDVKALVELFPPKVWCATVSVICERGEHLQARNAHQRELATDFAARLVEAEYDTRVFDPAGQDTIGGGCGQLWFVQQWMKDHPDKVRPSIGHGLPEVHVPPAQAAE